ncbi:MAG: 30S ribosomal protein S5 [Candidatus Omnitrophota bacterium]|nr:MAG: 30S ribosomal protein S5 [Candidatus Omnitrophota bacterium]
MKEKQKKETDSYDEAVLEIRRVTRVVRGGKRFTFRTTVAVGNRAGCVGIGTGRGKDVASSVEKARRDAQKKVFCFPLKNNRTVLYDVEGKYSSSRVKLKPAREGHGLVAGGSPRLVLDLAGVKDISAKMLGATSNKLTNALAVLKALKSYTKHVEHADTQHKEPKQE